MELYQLTTEELRGFETGKLRETETELRRSLVTIRMDIYTAKNQHTAKIRGLRKALARLLTIKHQAGIGVAPKAAKPAKAVVAPKAKAPKTAAKPKAKAAPAGEAKAPKAKTTKKAKS